MKRIMQFLNSSIRPVMGLSLAVLLFAACKKENDQDNIRTPAAGLMAFNLAPDANAAGFSLSGNTLGNSALAYTSFTGVYLPIYPGTREVRSFDYNSGSTIAISSGDFADSMYYSAFLMGTSGNYRNVVVQDQLDSLAAGSGKAWVRYVNAIPDSGMAPTVTINGGQTGGVDESAPFGKVSAFTQVNAGTVNTSVSNGGSISATRALTLEENKIYTVLLLGQPNQADSTKAVQVRFIQNGTITP